MLIATASFLCAAPPLVRRLPRAGQLWAFLTVRGNVVSSYSSEDQVVQSLPGESLAVLVQLQIPCLDMYHFTQPFGNVTPGQKRQDDKYHPIPSSYSI